MSEIARHWIDGEWVGSDTVSESVNSATGAVLGQWLTVARQRRVRPSRRPAARSIPRPGLGTGFCVTGP